MHNCQHCGNVVSENYCSNCGQKRNDGSLILKDLNSYLLEEVFTFESKLFKTIKRLFLNPGHIAWEFIKGDRSTYYNPVKFFILTTALGLFIRFVMDFDPVLVGVEAVSSSEGINEKVKKIVEIGQFFVRNNTYVILLFLILLSFFSKLLNFKKKISFIEYTIFFFFIQGQISLLTAFVTLLTPIDGRLFYATIFIQLPYLVFGLTQFIGEKKFINLIKNVFTIMISFMSFFIIMIIIFFLFIKV